MSTITLLRLFFLLMLIAYCACCGGNDPALQGESARDGGVAKKDSTDPGSDKGDKEQEAAGDDNTIDFYMNQEPPGDSPRVFAEGIVTTGAMEYRLAISPKGGEIFFTRDGVIMRCYALDAGSWTGPEAVCEGGETFYSTDGDTLYFCARRPIPGSNADLTLWRLERNERGWSDPTATPAALNRQTMHAPSISASGTIYISGIKRIRREGDGYSAAESLTPEIEGYSPFVAPDESLLVFSARRADGFGSTDLYVTFNNGDGSWTQPVHLGAAINTPASESNPSLSPDGEYLFFGRSHDIYWVKAAFLRTLKP